LLQIRFFSDLINTRHYTTANLSFITGIKRVNVPAVENAKYGTGTYKKKLTLTADLHGSNSPRACQGMNAVQE